MYIVYNIYTMYICTMVSVCGCDCAVCTSVSSIYESQGAWRPTT